MGSRSNIPERKWCFACGTERPVTEFSSNRTRADGLETSCRLCKAEHSRRRRARYLAAGLCADCGKPRDSRSRRFCSRCLRVGRGTQGSRALRQRVLVAYGGDPPRCACCSEAGLQFLSLDHIRNGGKAHRRHIGDAGHSVYRELARLGFPSGYQVLCFNCNMARGFYGICPHRGTIPSRRNDKLRQVTDIADPQVLRRCTRCNQLVPRGAYYRDRGGAGGLQSRCGACTRDASLSRLNHIRDEAISYYAVGRVCCACCGESTREFLALDHISGDGSVARRTAGSAGKILYVWLKKQGFPPGIQLLCHNCNCAKRVDAVCPHANGRNLEVAGSCPALTTHSFISKRALAGAYDTPWLKSSTV